jgi:micrococcal nuclease
MKSVFVVTAFLFLAIVANAQTTTPTVKPEEAQKYIGQTVTVCGKIFTARFLEQANKQPTLLNMGAAFPNQPFTVVLFGESRVNFSYKPEEFLNGKEICVTGLVQEYKGKPQMIITKEAEIKLAEKKAE